MIKIVSNVPWLIQRLTLRLPGPALVHCSRRIAVKQPLHTLYPCQAVQSASYGCNSHCLSRAVSLYEQTVTLPRLLCTESVLNMVSSSSRSVIAQQFKGAPSTRAFACNVTVQIWFEHFPVGELVVFIISDKAVNTSCFKILQILSLQVAHCNVRFFSLDYLMLDSVTVHYRRMLPVRGTKGTQITIFSPL